MNHIVGNAMNVREAPTLNQDSDNIRLKNLDAALLRPIKTNRRSQEKDGGDEVLAQSSTRKSLVVTDPQEPIDLRKLVELCEGFDAKTDRRIDLKELLTVVEETEATLQLLLS